MAELFSKNVTTAVRTPRFAVLVDKHEVNWKAYINGIVQTFSQVWGGEHFIIVPTDGKTIDPAFWKILEAYSPDYIGRYIPSISDLEQADIKKYEEIKARHKAGWGLSDDDFKNQWNEKATMAHLGGLDVDKSLSEELKNRLSPFYFDDHVVKENVFHDSHLAYPFTQIEHIVESAKDRPTEIFSPLEIEDEAYKLLALSRVGALSKSYARTLESKGFTVKPLSTDPEVFRLRDYIEALEENDYDPRWQRAMHEDSDKLPPDDFIHKLPFKMSMLHLGKYYRHATHRDWQENITVVVGDTMDDYCLYYCLSRLHDGVFWMPDSHLNEAHKKVIANRGKADEDIEKFTDIEGATSELVNTYYKAIKYGHDKDKKINLTSATLTTRQLQYRKQWMSEICFSGSDILPHCIIVPFDELPITCVMQVIEMNNHYNQQDIVFQDRQSIGRINTPKPKNFNPVNPSEHRWITTVNIDGFRPPALPFLGSTILMGMNSVQETRVAKDELAYFCPNVAYFGGDIDSITARPTISLPLDADILRDYFADSGYTTELSDKGSYLKDTIERFGSLEQTATFFRTESKRNIFDQYLVTKPDQGDDEIVRLSVESRTYLSFEAFRRKLGDENEAITLLDELIAKDIVYRGLIFQCSRCRLAAWYDIGSVSSTFTCSRCGFNQTYNHSNWKQPAEPKWYYRLAETVYLFYESSSHLTALALDKLRLEAPDEFHYESETNILNPQSEKPKQEIDILAISKGNIILGECKDCPVEPSDIRKYLTIFAQLNIQPTQFLLATTEQTVASTVQTELDKFKSHRLFTRDDLYS
ncbi:MAG: hypothetical protein JNK33_00670 [Candidatus Doudnabacteria bacterium]|nr:hypothetical protein [Candidatus Doudnabacteria bacterium]